ncbi:MAG: type III pantothenate kinase [Acutalibacteraceae bacterium]|nr:type III pantothenate kinase [Acutalibacteraceae bacterium]
MILVFDVGNTNITLGGYENDKLKFSSRLKTDHARTSDQYAVEIKCILELNAYPVSCIEGAIIGSVVPKVAKAIKQGLEKYFNIEVLDVGPGVKTGLNIKIDNPAQLGADLVCGAVGAIYKYKAPIIIFDLGTAITASVIDKDGAFLGGTISAGLNMSLDALAKNTANLPHIALDYTKSVIGKNTVDSMRAGLVLGAASMLDGLAQRIFEQLNEKATVVATGGNAKYVIKNCKEEIIYDENLLLDGLKIIFDKNKK